MAYTIRLDHDKLIRFMRLYLYQLDVRPIVKDVIMAGFESGYYEVSDGITWMHQLNFSGTKLPHPAGVGHDLCYDLGIYNPWLPIKDISQDGARRWSDKWFKEALLDFGHPYRARVYYIGLRVGANYGWWCHRRKNNPKPELLAEVLRLKENYALSV